MSFNESNAFEQMILDVLSADIACGNRPFELKDAPGWALQFALFTKVISKEGQ
jgi:hypothetical protein